MDGINDVFRPGGGAWDGIKDQDEDGEVIGLIVGDTGFTCGR